ncbi:hypothetical protein [Tengunoibacter tsumagoiensis]|nr:hypothetical protein [Tengunoibacter tsumagoiensis]
MTKVKHCSLFFVFEPREIRSISFTRGRLIWNDDIFDERLAVPQPLQPRAHPIEGTTEWHLG